MLSGKLIHLIEEHWNDITASVLEQIRRDPGLSHLRTLPELELREWSRDVSRHLGQWIATSSEEALAERYQELGRLRFTEGVPLHECVRALCILREKMLDYEQDHFFARNSLEFSAEEELERRLGHYFDLLTCSLVRGYERALRLAAHVEAA